MKKVIKLIVPALLIWAVLTACSNQSSPETDSANNEAVVSNTPEADVKVVAESPQVVEAVIETNDASETEEAVRAADAHIHGAAELAVVLEGDIVIVELKSPLYNLLGFEHTPETQAQKTAVLSAETQLMLGESLFRFNAPARCEYQPKNVAITLFNTMSKGDIHDHHGEDHDLDHGHADEDDHSHDAEHNHAHEVGEDKDHSHGDHHDHGHKDVVLQYSYKCGDSSKLAMMTIGLFDAFDNMSDLDVVYLGPSTQKQVNLNRNQTKVDLTP